MATIYKVETFSDIISAVQEELGADPNDTKVTNRIKRDINMVYMQGIAAKKPWFWLRRRTELQTEAFFSTGTAAVTSGSTSVTLTESPAVSYKGYYFSSEAWNERYRIAQHTAGSSTLVLESPYAGTTASAATFKMWNNVIPLPPETRETLKVTHSFQNTPLENLGQGKYEETEITAPKAEGRPRFYTTGRLVKASPYDSISGLPATATRASSGLLRTVKFASTLGASEAASLIKPGDKIEVADAGNQAYNGKFTVATLSTTDAANDTITYVAETRRSEAATADTGFTVTKKSSEDNDSRFREFMFYPSVNDTVTTLYVEYVVEPTPLENNDDEPLIPIEDRSILVFGALSRQHLKATDPDIYGINRQEFEAKYAEMASSLEDSTDHAQLKINKNYMRGKRRVGTFGSSTHPVGLSGFGVGGGASEIFGTADRAAIFNSEGRLVSSSTIDTTELGYLNGVTSNIQTQLDAKLGTQGSTTDNAIATWDGTGGSALNDTNVLISDSDAVSGITQLSVDNIDINGNTISSTDTDGDIVLSPDGSGEVQAGGTANHVLINSATGGITSEAQLVNSRGGTGLDTSASTGVAQVSSGTWSIGTVSITNGGTGETAATAAFDALAPTTTKGDVIAHDGTDNIRVAIGANNTILTADSGETSGVRWAALSVGTSGVSTITGAYTILTGDDVLLANSSTDFTLTLPTAVGNTGKKYDIKNINTNSTTIDGDGSETIDGATTQVLGTQYESITIVSDGSNWHVI